ncbi:sugar transporter [Pseudomonas sp. gcc21]|uniref:PelD GGDEF domain-containing protein n=1 Tax=Pseudomonas sp. gcc21 TaxID=2726989 RepID=UPI001451803F|nr:PelD GGDEF domain-containing protein [Pseudomonas sp. gcc21]QJD57897.1 sugar transporter [Pseudomonas sp. gcc21]
MDIDLSHKEDSLAPQVGSLTAWAETLGFTALVLALGFWLAPGDPLQVFGFPWPMLAPLLLGVRYGFFKALVSASLLVFTLLLLRFYGPLYDELPGPYIIGVLVSSMLVGEFRDLWGRRLERLKMANDYRQYRLDEFTRAHQMLRISHDRLEQRVAGSDQSLRSSLLLLRERMREVKTPDEALIWMAEPIISLLGQYGSLRVAGLYAVNKEQQVLPWPLATIGEMGEIDADDRMIRLCVDRGDLVSVGADSIERGEEKTFSSLQACIPLIDTHGNLIALLAVRQMPFFLFNDKTLSLLVLLAGHAADLLQSDPRALQLPGADMQSFSQHLYRSLLDAERHRLPGTLCLLELPEVDEDLMRLFFESQRGLDLHLRVRNGRGHDCLLILMPLTPQTGVGGFVARLEQLLTKRFGPGYTLLELEVVVRQFELPTTGSRSALREFLFKECELNEGQIAI